jgi:hypothetical protein
MGMEYISPIRSKTIVFPSGLTSREIQVPWLAVKLILRSGSRGSSFVAFLRESGVDRLSWENKS